MSLRHARRRSATPTRPSRRERGAVLVEFAIVASILAMMIGGTYDYGMAWRATLAVNEGARGGARVAAGVGSSVQADRQILTSLQSTLASSRMLDAVDQVVIFSAAATGGVPSAACINGTGGRCNTFTGNQFRAVTQTSPIGATGCITSSTRQGFCPTTRNDVQITADYVGVWVRARYTFMFKFIRTDVLIQRSAVMRIEP